MPELSIRAARMADIPALVAINEAGQPGVSPLTAALLADTLVDAPYCMVAILNEQLAGYLIGYTADDTYDGEEFAWFQAHLPRFLYIDQVAVAPAARRAHVGSRLYAYAIAHARALALPALVCEVNLDPPNPTSLRFHAQQGFEEIGVLLVSDGRTISLRRKDLSVPAL